ncbi:MAG TPA: type II secretion system F family protein [Nocardioidaceae bacterium]
MAGQTFLIVGLSTLFLAVVIILGTIGALTSERQQISRSLQAIRALEGVSSGTRLKGEADRPFGERVLVPARARLTGIGRRLSGADKGERLRYKLDLAGNPPGWDVDRVLAFKALGLLSGVALGTVVPLLIGQGVLVAIGAAIGVAALGYFAPNIWLYQLGYNRTERMRRDLPDAMDLLTISVEAGLAFDAALAQVARNTEGPLADEFFRVLQEMQIGMGRSEALRALGDRSVVPELRSFTAAMVQADAFGIPIAHVLRVQASEMRIKRRQRAEELAQKVPVKILFPLIFCIMPTLFVVILGPGAIQIIDFFKGG